MTSVPRAVRHRARPEDTSPEAWRRQFEIWRKMTPAEKALLCGQLSVGVVRLTEAGIRATEGEISDERMRWLLTQRRYGRDLAEEAFGPEPQT